MAVLPPSAESSVGELAGHLVTNVACKIGSSNISAHRGSLVRGDQLLQMLRRSTQTFVTIGRLNTPTSEVEPQDKAGGASCTREPHGHLRSQSTTKVQA
jgi:hypothetical protein